MQENTNQPSEIKHRKAKVLLRKMKPADNTPQAIARNSIYIPVKERIIFFPDAEDLYKASHSEL